MSNAVWAMGTTLKKDGVAIAELTSISGLDLDSDELDVTSLDSTGGYEEVIQTIRRTGTVSLEGNFVPGDVGQQALMDDYLDGTVGDYTITFPKDLATEWSFQAFVKKPVATEASVDDKVTFSAELRVTGQPSLNITQSGNLTDLSGIEENTEAALTFTPTFDASTYEYVTTVDTTSTWVKFTVTGSDTLEIDGTKVTTATPSDELDLGAAGTITTFSITRQEDGKIPTEYKVYVARASA